jgi:RNA polymerase sigma-70 factor (ECF subfamily)
MFVLWFRCAISIRIVQVCDDFPNPERIGGTTSVSSTSVKKADPFEFHHNYSVTIRRSRGYSRHHQPCPAAVIAALEVIPVTPRLSAEAPVPRASSAIQIANSGSTIVDGSARYHAVASASEQRSDHALMLAVREGELDALGELFERHHGPLFGFLVKLTGKRPVAEDIVQTVFQRMLRYRHTYRDDGRFTAWMYHLARHCTADHFRKSSAEPHSTDPADLHRHADEAPHAAEHATTHDDHELLHAALARLDRNDREVLLLSRFQDLSFAEISGILECSVGAAKVRAHRALCELREIYFQLLTSKPRMARSD